MLTSVTLASRAESADIDFARDIRPILQAHCYECHGPDLSENDLRLDQLASVKRGGETGSDLLSSDPDQNELYQRVTATDPDVRMPPEGEPLSDEQLATLLKWVEQGADWPGDQTGPATKTDWLHSALSLYEDYLAPHVAALLIGAIMVGLMERAKVWHRKTQANGRATNGFADRLAGRVARLPRAWYLVVLFGWMAAYLWVDRGQLNNEIDRLSLLDQPLTTQIYAASADPPRPRRRPRPDLLPR